MLSYKVERCADRETNRSLLDLFQVPDMSQDRAYDLEPQSDLEPQRGTKALVLNEKQQPWV